ncbi:dihydropyrimidinase [Kaustia mangrovi]|uniref:Dihydropyrimidinase n=1 Tax=Kaustia mangrovi TaxID=2593653 RepID=A0A7S8C598_9HYPH|nr:dihydropyrimidinase [Kaustia mangrovi]QPC43581.1 dihydropyrimidinase [Kaustia mangrovi]
MSDYDLVIANGLAATATDTFRADIGIRDGRIVAIAEELEGGARTIDATAKLVLPGGIESHCHIAQESASGIMTSDDYYTGSVSAAFGGNTTFIPFAAQHRGQTIADVLKTYDDRAAPKSVIDYSYHLIVSDPTEAVLKEELPAAFERGITSFKVFLTYDLLKVEDEQMLDILTVAREHGALTMVHAENNALIKWMSARLMDKDYSAPKYHAVSHPRAAEVEAINRGIALAGFVDAPLLIVHVSTEGGARAIADARREGLKIYGETCPQYLFLTSEDMDRPGAEGAKFCCSPPLRDTETQDVLWRYLQTGGLQLYSSDHAPYRYDETGKLVHSKDPTFKQVANGLPGIEMRAPLLFSEGVRTGRISLNQFVSLTATNAAKMFGLHPQKGTIAVGADADLAIWDPDETRTVTAGGLHDNMDYTPFEGLEVTGWPVTMISRGRVIVEGGELLADAGQGTFLKRAPHEPAGLSGRTPPELDPAQSFGAKIV